MDLIDDETATLILQLQLEDSNELAGQLEGKGKGHEGVLSDAQVALQMFREDLDRNSSILVDRVMTRSIAKACLADGQLISSASMEEQTAFGDRDLARRLRNHPNTPGADHSIASGPSIASDPLDDDILSKLSALYVSVPDTDLEVFEEHMTEPELDAEGNAAESSSWALNRRKALTSQTRLCAACQEEVVFYNTARAQCGHEYCRDCLRDLFLASFMDESLFPPRCCRQTITTDSVRLFLTSELVRQYEAKQIEYDTVDRTYCSNPLCSVFIIANNIQGELATCSECGTGSCTMCKAGSHTGEDCPEDTGLQLVLRTAQEHGWQRCYSCRRLVELNFGCNHMTCTCKAQFCYACGEQWKTCLCEQWDENRLIYRAQQVLARRPSTNDRPRQQQVQAAVNDLRNRHTCDHESWRCIQGSAVCEECAYVLPGYIFECRQCYIRACNRC